MTALPARDCLTIFVEGKEVPGLIVYGLAVLGSRHQTGFPSNAWRAVSQVDVYTLRGEAWEVGTWDVPIIIWPAREEFVAAVRLTLGAMIEGGCRVAWVGAEGLPFCDPPQLFDPDCMSGGVLAWMTDDGTFDCPLDPDSPLAPVPDAQLRVLRGHSKGLADAT